MQRLTGERMMSCEMGQRKKLGILTSSPRCCGGSLMAVSFRTMGRPGSWRRLPEEEGMRQKGKGRRWWGWWVYGSRRRSKSGGGGAVVVASGALVYRARV